MSEKKPASRIDLRGAEDLHRRRGTTFFRLLNPELFVRPSWRVGLVGTLTMLGALGYVYYKSVQYEGERAERIAEIRRQRILDGGTDASAAHTPYHDSEQERRRRPKFAPLDPKEGRGF